LPKDALYQVVSGALYRVCLVMAFSITQTFPIEFKASDNKPFCNIPDKGEHQEMVMETVFLGRQPIFDRKKQVMGYELLHRSNRTQNSFGQINGDDASTEVIRHSLSTLPLSQIVGKHQAFINITRKLLIEQTYTLLPNNQAVVELLENVEVDPDVIAACKALKKADYTLALDDYTDSPQYAPLLDYVDLIKIDFLTSDWARRRHFADRYGYSKIMLLAEKVENQSDFDEAYNLGYAYFQGYFFCKPEILSAREVPVYKRNYLMFIQELNREPMDFERLEKIIKSDVSLSTNLLRYINSCAMGFRYRLTSIRQALAMLGEGPLRKWASLAAIKALCDGKPSELLVTSLVRARFCELLAPKIGLAGSELNAFLVGLLSTMDALMDQPLEQVIASIPVSPNVSAALLGADTILGHLFKMIVAIEQGNEAIAGQLAANFKLPLSVVSACYMKALNWSDDGAKALAA
jgi:c-di-GMP-related signal transduction protein